MRESMGPKNILSQCKNREPCGSNKSILQPTPFDANLKADESDNKHLEERVTHLIQQQHSQEAEYKRIIETIKLELQEKEAQHMIDTEENQKQMQKLQKELSKRNERVSQLKKERDSEKDQLEQEINGLKKELRYVTSNDKIERNQIDKHDLELIKTENESLKSKKSELEKLIQNQDEKQKIAIEESKMQFANLKEEIQRGKQDNSQLKEQNESLKIQKENEIYSLKKEIEDKESEHEININQLVRQIDDLKLKLSFAATENDSIVHQKNDLEEALKKKTSELAKQEKNDEKLEKTLKATERDRDDATSCFQELQNKNTKLKADSKEKSRRLVKIDELKDENTLLQECVEELTERNDKLKEQVQKMYDELKKALKEQDAGYEKISLMEEELKSLRGSLKSNKEELHISKVIRIYNNSYASLILRM